MKKLTVDKEEGIADVIDRILAVGDSHITLVIPRGSALAKSAGNFRLLKREADAAEKTVVVESVDDAILALAEEHGLGSGHSFLKGRPGALSDIIPKSATKEPSEGKRSVHLAVPDEEDAGGSEEDERRGDAAHGESAMNGGEDVDLDKEEQLNRAEAEESFFGAKRFFSKRSASSSGGDEGRAERGGSDGNRYDNEEDGGERRGSGRAWWWTIGILAVVALAFYVVTTVFAHAQVLIDFTQTPWNYQNNFIADKAVATTTMEGQSVAVPAQVFTTDKNITQLFPATGSSQAVSVRAQGTITIYNDYGAASQDLVATTRFMTPDGKIFRLVNSVTVPGAKVAADGTITPSSITAPIVADQPGPSYNVGPIAKLTIPGFQKYPAKYAGFYGAIAGATSGGFTGVRMVPTLADIAAAKASTTAILQADLESSLSSSYPNNFKILDGATDIQITKMTVSTSTDANGNFTVFAAATLQAIGFDEQALENWLLGQTNTANGITPSFKTVNLSYANVQADFTNGRVSFALNGQGTIEPAFSSAQFAQTIAGDSINRARNLIQGLPDLASGKISVWPIWLWNMPSDPGRIQVTAN